MMFLVTIMAIALAAWGFWQIGCGGSNDGMGKSNPWAMDVPIIR